jgi:hypothetical protein
MNGRKLANLRGRIAAMRRSPQRARDVEQLAIQLGRRQEKRGKEPMWMSEHFKLPALAIPHHGGGRDLSTGTCRSILTQLEDDVIEWERVLAEADDDEEEE